DGRTTVVKAGKQFEKLAENRIKGPLVATPAILDGTVFLRTDSSLYRIGKKQEATARHGSNGELKMDAEVLREARRKSALGKQGNSRLSIRFISSPSEDA